MPTGSGTEEFTELTQNVCTETVTVKSIEVTRHSLRRRAKVHHRNPIFFVGRQGRAPTHQCEVGETSGLTNEL